MDSSSVDFSHDIAVPEKTRSPHAADDVRVPQRAPADGSKAMPVRNISVPDIICRVADRIAPVWPLQNFVAVNPYFGFAQNEFLKARSILQSFSDAELLMPLDYYRRRYQQQRLTQADIAAAVEDLNTHATLSITVESVVQAVSANDESKSVKATQNVGQRSLHTLAERVDQQTGTDWARIIRTEVGRVCAAHYDEGQAVWSSPWKQLSLYQEWQAQASRDRSLELQGATNCRELFAALPDCPEAAIDFLLQRLQVPEQLCENFLLCQLYTLPGWSAWTKYKSAWEPDREQNDAFSGLLAIRLACDTAVAEAAGVQTNWQDLMNAKASPVASDQLPSEADAAIRMVLLRASELAWERQLLKDLTELQDGASAAPATTRDNAAIESSGSDFSQQTTAADASLLAQMVFCIDVRSERFRRQLEHVTSSVQTLGFAGFFGVPIAWQAWGEDHAAPQVPALLTPQFTVRETLQQVSPEQSKEASRSRSFRRLFRKSWKQLQTSAVSCFSFVETAGLLFGWKLAEKSLGRSSAGKSSQSDGLHKAEEGKLRPDLSDLEQIGVSQDRQIEMAESILRGMGLIDNFATLVVFCGHGSETQNNPLQAGLDCGACCGHSGEPNARFAALLLNQNHVRNGLQQRGICVPATTRFLAAVHNTTHDAITYFDTDLLTADQQQALQQLMQHTTLATQQTQLERLPSLATSDPTDPMRRSLDWSEVRPEWGLAGNAAFIVAPRELTSRSNLDGRSFLHSYDDRKDPEGKVLEQIMTAPLVVGHWINMQYYASTVDPQYFGSGSKTIHNVVGQFGIYSGNGGDLTTGLPWQSVHNGQDFQHEPLRLLAIIAAPKERVAAIISRHELLDNLLTNQWMNLVVVEDSRFYRYTPNRQWQEIALA